MKPPIVALVIGIDEKDSVVTPGSGVRGGGANFAPLNLFYAFMKMILLGRGRSVPGPPPSYGAWANQLRNKFSGIIGVGDHVYLKNAVFRFIPTIL